MPESTSSSRSRNSLWAVVLAGGVGSRFWPVSTPQRPKQIVPLTTARPLITETVERILPLVPQERLRILTGASLRDPIADAAGIPHDAFMLEPAARGTAPVLTWAAHQIRRTDPGAVMISLHADHAITPEDTFRTQLEEVARAAAAEQRLYTIGVRPTRAETGYGYIRTGSPLSVGYEVAEFVEKPDAATAERYVASDQYVWNSGIFVWPVALFLAEVGLVAPELASLLPLLDAGDVEAFFERAPNLSVDEGVLERSRRVAVAPARFEWDDVGAWAALGRNRSPDSQGNVSVGDAHLVDARGCTVWSEDGTVVIFGAENLVVVHANGVTFVAPRERTADLKDLLRVLPPDLRNLEGS